MKLLPSYSISSSSSSSTSFDPNMCTSKSTTVSCLSGILRRILCSRTLPTYPSDLMTETSSIVGENKKHFGKLDQASNGASPGIVARLMGLESLPETASGDHLLRSRSMNSAEFRDECVVDGKKSLLRRVKSTLSVREMLTFVEAENEEFFVLSFDDGGDYKKGENKMRKLENVVEEIKNEDEEKIKKMVSRILNEGCISSRILDEVNHENFGNEGLIHDSHWKDSNLDSSHKFDFMHFNEVTHDVARSRNKRKKKKKHNDHEPQCSSEESSPVSVLDFNQFLIDPSEQEESNPRRDFSEELGTDFMVQDQNSSKRTDTCHISPKKPFKSFNGSSLWSEICKLSECEVIFSNWVPRNNSKLQDFEDIGQDLGQQIMDQLLEELVDLQLVD